MSVRSIGILASKHKENDMLIVSYDEDADTWTASWNDDLGQIGESFAKSTQDYAVLALGFNMGRFPTTYIREGVTI